MNAAVAMLVVGIFKKRSSTETSSDGVSEAAASPRPSFKSHGSLARFLFAKRRATSAAAPCNDPAADGFVSSRSRSIAYDSPPPKAAIGAGHPQVAPYSTVRGYPFKGSEADTSPRRPNRVPGDVPLIEPSR